ncbi:CLUMA_CG005608, isoform A [Clunio marinus]|uniref:CLUMA_CG005608, isoform A n=1 Tax=Clunio marinus TaxID=568069 RepID=A0A1J1HXG0_9DIPT|nr:CLUMA_CG005608, isoform A [Clunio marinus]
MDANYEVKCENEGWALRFQNNRVEQSKEFLKYFLSLYTNAQPIKEKNFLNCILLLISINKKKKKEVKFYRQSTKILSKNKALTKPKLCEISRFRNEIKI